MRNFDKYYKVYKKQNFEKILVSIRKKHLLDIIQSYQHDSILNIGCGEEALVFDGIKFKNMIILEPIRNFYNETLRLIDNAKIKHKVKIFNLKLEDAVTKLTGVEFDFVILSGVLHETDDLSDFMNIIRKISSQKTTVYINVPNAKSFHRVLAKESGIITNEYEMSENQVLFQQKNLFDLKTLSELMHKNGFKVIDKGSFFIKPFSHAQMGMLLEQNIITMKVIEGLYNISKYLEGFGSEIYVISKLK